jgi:hypothetical protein
MMLDLSSTLTAQVANELGFPTAQSTQAWGQELGIAEWLGPLAPVALSPFFGLATLSGVATYGPAWMQQHSALLQSGSSLNNPILFWTMASLAIFTSLPRMTKVSKPIGLAAEKLETYSAIIILIVVRMFGSQYQNNGLMEPVQASHMVVAAGLGSLSLNLLLSLFAAINIFVINAVKLFAEYLIWLIPFPSIDAIVEAANKSVCVGLMGLYCYSPWLASLVNLTLLLACLLVFSWVYRRLNLYRELIAGPILAWLVPWIFAQKSQTFTAFLEQSPVSLARYSRVRVTVVSDLEYVVKGSRWCVPFRWKLRPAISQETRSQRVLSQSLTLEDDRGRTCVVVFRKWNSADSLYREPKVAVS